MIGTTVSRYKILSKLGGGGMGVVYEAEDTQLGRHVAIKFLPDGAAHSDAALERFKREARAASALNHPHICTVYDVGTHDEQPYLVMERLSGRTLKHVIGSHAMPVDEVVKLGEQIADALDAAHRAGIVHRDLKPANLFVTARGDAKILDFGLAKMMPAEVTGPVSADAPTVTQEFLTETGTALGTRAYMSPEQARGQQVDARSDIFSLGVVLYEMATGRLPFKGQTAADVLVSILNTEATPPRDSNPEIPAKLGEVILKALEKDPVLRYQSAAGLRSDLLLLQRELSTASRLSAAASPEEKSFSGSRRGLWIGLSAAVIAVLAGFGYFTMRSGGLGSREPVRAGPAETSSAPAAPRRSIAVLPFADLSPEKNQEYFSDGISGELIDLLTRVPQLQVTARNSSFSFKGKNVSIPEIARRLHVAHILTGSVQRAGSQVRITAQLIDAATDQQLWSQRYDRALDDIFKVQDEITADVVKELKVTLLGAPPKGRTTDPKAYALFLQARAIRRPTAEAFLKSDVLLHQVLAIDPHYAPAWNALALNFAVEGLHLGVGSSQEGWARAQEALQKALAIDPDYAPAYVGLGDTAMGRDHDLAAAAKLYERARALDPTDINLDRHGARFLLTLGRLDEAQIVYEDLVRRDPLNAREVKQLGIAQLYAGRYDAAIASFHTALSLGIEAHNTHFNLGMARLLQGDAPAALTEMQQASSPDGWWGEIGLPMVYYAMGKKAESDAALAELIQHWSHETAYNIAYVYAYRGEADKAFEWLGKAVEYNDSGLEWIVPEPLFDNIHSDPRWVPFLRELGMAPEQLAKVEFHVPLPNDSGDSG